MLNVTSSSVTVTENSGHADAIVGVSFDGWFEEQAKRIRAHLASMNKNADKAEQHRVSALHILDSVEKKLTVDGELDAIRFDLFKAKVCPELSTSQAYVKLAILTGRLTVVDHRNKQNARQAKHRKKVAETTAALRTPNGDAIDPTTLGPKAQEQLVRATGSADTELTEEQHRARMAALDIEAPSIVPADEPEIPEPFAKPLHVETAGEKSDRLLKAFKEIDYDAMTDKDFEAAKSWFFRYNNDRPKRLAKLKKAP